ncbi:hypothetical protein B296_00035094 [Ensete ventricosum]|uniref:Uncharacterized protein n=1 Tax=Ensete ventricosum TaxID=4639 RepID=A0A426XFD0_ENSVE|nr:hypothetical protein B296_00035094 [Ensete ventricosum]
MRLDDVGRLLLHLYHPLPRRPARYRLRPPVHLLLPREKRGRRSGTVEGSCLITLLLTLTVGVLLKKKDRLRNSVIVGLVLVPLLQRFLCNSYRGTKPEAFFTINVDYRRRCCS